jgi:NADH-quinone oxidoreductase subunit L
MTGPLVILAVGALAVGAYFQWTGDFLGREGYLMHTPSLRRLALPEAAEEAGEHGSSHLVVAAASTILALVGIALAWLLYMARRTRLAPQDERQEASGAWYAMLHTLSHGKFFIDEIYALAIVRPLEGLAWLLALADRYLVDGLVNAVGALPRALGSVLRPLQGGLVQFYALVMALGLLALIGALLVNS